MRILFCKISAMKFYKGVIPGKDEAFNGGSFVKEHGFNAPKVRVCHFVE